MKKRIGRIAIVLICFAICIVLHPHILPTASAATSGYYTYTVSNGGATITKCDTSISGDVTIPSTLGGYTVTRIGDHAFVNCFDLTGIVIPDSVTSIGYAAFLNCTGLTNMTIPDNVKSIEDSAFQNCRGLTSVTIPDSVTSIGNYAFYNCTGLTTLMLDCPTIGSCFSGLTSINSVTIGEHTTSIATGAFSGCNGLVSISLPFVGDKPHTTSDANQYPFGYIFGTSSYTGGTATTQVYYGSSTSSTTSTTYYIPSALRSVTITGSSYIPYGAFYNCTMLTSVTIGSGVTSIHGMAFHGCSGLTTVMIDCPTIGRCFSGLTSINSVTIGEHTTSIASGAFSGCNGLVSISLPFVGDRPHTTSDANQYPFGYIFGTSSYAYGTPTTQYYISSGTSTTSSTYYIPRSLKSVTITGSRYIQQGAFYNCNGLTSVTIPDSVTSIGEYSFYGCTGLTILTIPDCVTNIGRYAFSGCTKLMSVTIGNGVTSVGPSAFSGCTSLKDVHITDIAVWCGIDFYNSSSNPFAYAQNLYLSHTLITELVIPDSVTSIGAYSFYSCTGLTSISIPDNVTSVGYSAFQNCTGLTSVTIGSAMTSIGRYAFNGCTGLTAVYTTDIALWCGISFASDDSNPLYYGHNLYLNDALVTKLIIPDGVTSIGNSAFYNCTGLMDATIPESVTSIGNSAFYGCSGLRGRFLGDAPTLGTNAFNSDAVLCHNSGTGWTHPTYQGYRCIDLSEPHDAGQLDEDNRNYQGVLFTLGNGTAIVGNNTDNADNAGFSFYYDLVIPETVTDQNGNTYTVNGIGKNAFKNNRYVETVIIPKTLRSIGNDAFLGCRNLEAFSVDPASTSFSIDEAGVLYNKSKTQLLCYPGAAKAESYIVAPTVISIKAGSFNGLRYLKELTIPFVGISKTAAADSENTLFGAIFGTVSYTGSVSTTQYYAPSSSKTFYIPSSLEKVTVNGGTLRYGAFYGCEYLHEIVLENAVTAIADNAFYNCTALENLVISENVTSIAGGALFGCGNLQSMTLPVLGTNESTTASTEPTTPTEQVSGDYALASSVKGGDQVVIYNPGHGMAIKNETINDWYLVPQAVTPADNKIASPDASIVWTVVDNGDGTYSFVNGSNKISCWVSGNFFELTNDAGHTGSVSNWKVNWTDGLAYIQHATFSGTRDPVYIDCYYKASWDGVRIEAYSYSDPTAESNDTGWQFYVKGASGEVTTNGTSSGVLGYIFGDSSYSGGVSTDQYYATYYIPSALTSVTINKGDLNDREFYGCTNIESITLPEGSVINNYSFYGCSALETITIPDGFASIPDYAFYGCSELDGVLLSDECASIGSHSFYECANLSTLTIPAGCAAIGDNAFYNCQSLETVNIPGVVTEISPYTFYGCSSLAEITIPANATSIGNYAFCGCDELLEAVTPDSVITVGASAFASCAKLAAVSISRNVESIGKSAFADCPLLSSISYYAKNCGDLNTSDNVFANSGTSATGGLQAVIGKSVTVIPNALFKGSRLTSIVFEHGINLSSIGAYAFYDSNLLAAITIPGSITSIGEYAFYNCCALEEITISDFVTSIGNSTFYGCTSLASVTLPEELQTVANNAFYSCSKLTEIDFPATVTSIGIGALQGCSKLQKLTVPFVGGSPAQNTYLGYLFGASSYNYNSNKVPASLKDVIILDGAAKIASNAFNGCSNIVHVTIPDSVTEIGENAFLNCSSLTDIYVSDQVTALGNNAFKGCTAVETMYLGQYVNSLNAFDLPNYSALTAIRVSNENETYMSDSAGVLYDKAQTTLICYPQSNSWPYYNVSTATTAISSDAFLNNGNLINVLIPNTVTSIANGNFSGCWNVTLLVYLDSTGLDYAIDNGISYEIADYMTLNGIAIQNLPLSNTYIQGSEFDFEGLYVIANYDIGDLLLNDYTLTYDKDTLGPQTVTVSYLDYTATFAITVVAPSITRIEVTPPSQTEYIEGVALNLTDMLVKAFWDNGNETFIPLDSVSVIGGTDNIGSYRIQIVYTDAADREFSDSFRITVLPKTPISLEIQALPDKTVYELEDWLDLSGMIVDVCFDNGTTESVSDFTVSGFDNSVLGNQTLTVSYGEFTRTFTVTVEKKTNHTIPVDPVAEEITASSVVLKAVDGYEYSLDGETWQDDNTFENLDLHIAYSFYQRVKETEDFKPSVSSNALIISTKYPLTGFVAVSGRLLNGQILTAKSEDITPFGATVSYQWYRDGIAIEGEVNATYTVTAIDLTASLTVKATGTGNYYGTLVGYAPPKLPSLEEQTANSVTLVSVEGLEYSCDGEAWQASNVFENLTPNTTYTFYQRVARTAESPASGRSEPISIRLSSNEHTYSYTDNGNGTHTVTCSHCDYRMTEAHEYVNGICACGAVRVTIDAAYPMLNENINMVYAVSVPAEAENVYMVFTYQGTDYTITEYTVNGNGQYCFEFTNINPQCIGDSIPAVLHTELNGEAFTATVANYSVKQYCVNMLNNPRYNSDAKLVALLSDLLTYGAAAQQYTGYHTDNLITAGLDLAPSAFSVISGKTVSFSGTADTATDWISAGLILSNKVAMRFTFFAESIDGLTVNVSINGREEVINAEDFVSDGSGKYHIDFQGIEANEFDDAVTATFYRGGKTVGRTVGYTVNAYVCSTQNSNDANLRALVRALYNYGASAAAYSSAE